LGADPQSSTLPERIFNGKIDEVAVFNYALSATQLGQLYALASGGLALGIQRAGDSVVINWPLGTLQQASSVAGPWTTVSNATSPFTNIPSGTDMFYRAVANTP
jgi:hypothetical protein